MKPLFFTEQDFESLRGVEDENAHDIELPVIMTERSVLAAKIANARLEQMLANAPVVYGKNTRLWDFERAENDTHTARLVDIKPMGEE